MNIVKADFLLHIFSTVNYTGTETTINIHERQLFDVTIQTFSNKFFIFCYHSFFIAQKNVDWNIFSLTKARIKKSAYFENSYRESSLVLFLEKYLIFIHDKGSKKRINWNSNSTNWQTIYIPFLTFSLILTVLVYFVILFCNEFSKKFQLLSLINIPCKLLS